VEFHQWQLLMARLDPVKGSEQGGRRPVLVVSNDEFNQNLPCLTVVPLTTTDRRLYPSEVPIPANAAGNPRDSRVLAHQIRTISQERIEAVIGELRDDKLQRQVLDAIVDHLGIELTP
jgi:mRNA interferase MazF